LVRYLLVVCVCIWNVSWSPNYGRRVFVLQAIDRDKGKKGKKGKGKKKGGKKKGGKKGKKMKDLTPDRFRFRLLFSFACFFSVENFTSNSKCVV